MVPWVRNDSPSLLCELGGCFGIYLVELLASMLRLPSNAVRLFLKAVQRHHLTNQWPVRGELRQGSGAAEEQVGAQNSGVVKGTVSVLMACKLSPSI